MSITTTAGLTAYFHYVDGAGAADGANTLTGVAVVSATAATTTTATATTAAAATTPGSTTAASTTAASTTTTAAAPVTASTLADGTYTGATATNKWGPVQVQVTISGGAITEVVALQTPTDDRKSISINARAIPTLASEVLSAQAADVDTVSGATYTSESYKASLQSAIDLARATAQQTSA